MSVGRAKIYTSTGMKAQNGRVGRSREEEYIERLIVENRELAVREFAGLSRRLAALRREIRELRRIINEGEQMTFPWFDLPRPRMKAVEAVHGYMREHPDVNILSACRATFRPADGGYPNLKALAAYCYQINLEMYV